MAATQSSKPQLSTAELRLLGHLNQKWPLATTVTQTLVPMSESLSDRAGFVDMIQALNDNGLIMYEAFLIEASSGMRFIETMITPRGKAALQSAEIHA